MTISECSRVVLPIKHLYRRLNEWERRLQRDDCVQGRLCRSHPQSTTYLTRGILLSTTVPNPTPNLNTSVQPLLRYSMGRARTHVQTLHNWLLQRQKQWLPNQTANLKAIGPAVAKLSRKKKHFRHPHAVRHVPCLSPEWICTGLIHT